MDTLLLLVCGMWFFHKLVRSSQLSRMSFTGTKGPKQVPAYQCHCAQKEIYKTWFATVEVKENPWPAQSPNVNTILNTWNTQK